MILHCKSKARLNRDFPFPSRARPWFVVPWRKMPMQQQRLFGPYGQTILIITKVNHDKQRIFVFLVGR